VGFATIVRFSTEFAEFEYVDPVSDIAPIIGRVYKAEFSGDLEAVP
jgi:hypothetical protein